MMFRTILLGLDGSQGSKKALRKAVLLAREADGRVHALAVQEHLPRFAATVGETDDAHEEREAFFKGVMGEAVAVAAEQGVPLTTEIIQGNAPKVIVDRAKQVQADVIVIGHTSSVWGNILGSTADKVVDHAHCDVLIVR
jgi:nucleotide-binding universal stress UspA family protein